MKSRVFSSGSRRSLQVVWFILALIVLVMYILAVPAFMDDISRSGQAR
jgi:hypothetical protein